MGDRLIKKILAKIGNKNNAQDFINIELYEALKEQGVYLI